MLLQKSLFLYYNLYIFRNWSAWSICCSGTVVQRWYFSFFHGDSNFQAYNQTSSQCRIRGNFNACKVCSNKFPVSLWGIHIWTVLMKINCSINRAMITQQYRTSKCRIPVFDKHRSDSLGRGVNAAALNEEVFRRSTAEDSRRGTGLRVRYL